MRGSLPFECTAGFGGDGLQKLVGGLWAGWRIQAGGDFFSCEGFAVGVFQVLLDTEVQIKYAGCCCLAGFDSGLMVGIYANEARIQADCTFKQGDKLPDGPRGDIPYRESDGFTAVFVKRFAST